jgi:serine protease
VRAREFRHKFPFILMIALVSAVASLVSTESASAQLVITVPGDQPSIQSAIDVATAGDTVLVAPGTYVENINFQGKAVTVESEQGPEATVIDGNLAGPVVTFTSGEGQSSILRGFTLQRGLASNGGGVRINASSPTVDGNIITNNMACGSGGGVEADNSSARIEHNLITNNGQWSDCSGGPGGGGIGLVGAGQTQILDNTIMGNSWSSSSGGGITLFAAGAPVIRGNVIKANSAFESGGGLWIVNQSDASIVQNLIVDNHAGKGGGIYWGASAGTRGMLLVNNTIAGNQGLGSAIFAGFIDAKAQLFNNVAVGTSGQPAVYCDAFDNLNPPVFVSNNVYSAGGSAYGGVCADPTGVNGNLSVDPVFVDAAGGDYHLAAGSPSIDAGDNAAPELPATDIDGDRRVMNGRVDQGVDEFLTVAVSPSAPTNLAAVRGKGLKATVSWSPPLSDGGSPILSYTVTVSDGRILTVDASMTWVTFDGLKKKSIYSFTVVAINLVGPGDPASVILPAG